MIDTHQTGVYMIKNRTTGKFYVGSTSSSFKKRINSRINRGMTIGECIKFFDGYEKKMSIQEYCKTLGLVYPTVINRLARGMSLSDASSNEDIRSTRHKLKEAA